jgi:low temperature requirement protein LtrA
MSETNTAVSLMRAVRLWPGDRSSRRASWLELFFDLIFVAAVSQVGIPLGQDYTVHGLIRYSLMFLLIWWAWFGHTMYATRFDADDAVHRLLTLVQVFAAAAMAANAKQDLASRDSAGFGAAYAVQRIVLVIQYLRARREARTRGLASIHAAGFGAAALLWIVAALVPPPARFALWLVAVLIDLATPSLAAKYTHAAPPHPEHLPERFGLFTIILLGEFVAAVMRGMESQEAWPASAAISAFSGLALVFGLWWWYFDVAQGAAERHVKSRRDARLLEIWSYAHFPLYLGIAVLGIGIEHVISLPPGSHLATEHASLITGAALLGMGSLIVVGATSRSRARFPLRLTLAPLGFLLLGPVLARLGACSILVQLVAVCAAQILLGSYSGRKRKDVPDRKKHAHKFVSAAFKRLSSTTVNARWSCSRCGAAPISQRPSIDLPGAPAHKKAARRSGK